MAAITKVSLSFKETRQKTRQKNACKTRRYRAAEPAWRSLKKQVFLSYFFTFLNANCWSSFGGCFLNFSVFLCCVCLRKSLFLRKNSSFFSLVVGFSFSKKHHHQNHKINVFWSNWERCFFHEIFLRGRRHLSSCFFLFLKIYFACLKNW